MAYLLWWDNGLEFDDHQETLVAVCSSMKKLQKLKEGKTPKRWPFNDQGRFEESEVQLDELIY